MEKIIHHNILIAIRVRRIKKGITPITDPLEPLQVVTHNRPKNQYTKAHIHIAKKRLTQKLQECLIVIKGKIRIDLYTPKKKYFKHIYLSAGEGVILINGGHAVHILEDSEIIEIKNGPFVEDKELIE